MTSRPRIATVVLLAVAGLAQNQQVRPSFEVASVKPVKAGTRIGPLRGGPGTNSPGQLSGAATLKALLMRAYDLKDYQVAGPAWMDSERYEIAAKIPAGADKAQVSLMLQSLVAERFRLAAHRETRELPLYELLVAKNGPKFTESAAGALGVEDGAAAKPAAPKLIKGADGLPDILPGSTVPRTYQIVLAGSDGILYKLWGRRESMQQFADRLSAQLNRAVVDRTDLKGQYDFTFAWAIESSGGVIPRTGPPPDQTESVNSPVLSDPGLSLFAAVQTQLGLKLEPKKGPVEMLIIDSAEKTPIEN
jgi:uncharacterized protein (TIGR03435 family)